MGEQLTSLILLTAILQAGLAVVYLRDKEARQRAVYNIKRTALDLIPLYNQQS